jgi:alpha-D-xyloside xylohydrolase
MRWLGVAWATAVGCAAADPRTDDAPTIRWEGGLVLAVDGTDRVRVPRDGFVLGVAETRDDTRSYDPMFDEPPGVRWTAATAATPSTDGRTIALEHGADGTSTLSLEETAPGRVALRWVPDGVADATVYARLRLSVDEAEGFYGLGEVFDRPEHRGADRAMQLEVDPTTESFNNEAHVPVPLLIGTEGWGVFVADDHPMRFEVATEASDVVQITVGVGMDGDAGLAWHLFGAPHPLDVTAHYWAVTGAPALPAPWALGPLVWRDENRDQAEVEADLAAMRDLDLACSGVWIDRPYASGVNTFDFDPSKFPTPQAMIDGAHALGFRMGLWHVPYVSEDESPELHAEALAGGYFPPLHPPVVNKWSAVLDFTQPEASSWWQDLIRRYTDMGIEGFKLDYAEDVVVGTLGGRLPWAFADGSDERTMHKQFTRLYHQAYAEVLIPEQSFLLNRAGTWGDQVRSPIIWPGDLDASMAKPGAPDADATDSWISVGGLPAAVVAGSSLGPSGFPFFGSDTGGYRHSPPDKETFIRWFEHTALTPVMQIGTSTNDVAWQPTEENGFDDEVLTAYRGFVRLHQRLFPYLWSHAKRLATGGRPIQRPLGLAYPELGVHPAWDYLLGDDLLVAPVIDAGATTRDVTVPPGAWIDWFSGETLEGPGTATVEAPLLKLPLYLRAGGVVPLLRPTIDTVAPTTQPERVDSFDTDAGVLHVATWPAADGAFTLWDGTAVQVEPGRLQVEPGDVFAQGVVWEVLGDTAFAPSLDGASIPEVTGPAPAPSTWVADGRRFIAVPAGAREVTW